VRSIQFCWHNKFLKTYLYLNHEFVDLLKTEKLDTIPKPLANFVLDGGAL